MPAYVIVDSNVTNPELMKKYLEKVGPTVAAHGGRALASTEDVKVVEGDWQPKRVVLVEFPSIEDVNAWYDSPEYQEVMKIRHQAASDKVIFIDGL